ncbi:MAG: glutathione-disulfide reductase [Betaproteobacteria bacterium]|nr:glutathione-disulfide reductase [Betaproteobacteria bacterium]MDH3435688.1 glutathione-disulfide reductase [Betaproteobacteria bacterium]
MPKYDYDLFTIGAGSGGVRASRFAAGFGARVAIAEDRYLGGTCVNVGCIPKKLFSYAAHFHEDFEDAVAYGWRPGEPAFDWKTLVAHKDREIERLNDVYERLLKSSGVQLFQGRASVLDPHTVDLNGKHATAEHILVATGGWPVKPDIPGADLAFTSNEAFHLAELPRHVAVVGGGYIAVEFASIFNGLGVETTLIYRRKPLLRSFDADLGRFLGEQMAAKGITVRYDCNITAITRNGSLHSTLTDGTVLESDGVMLATGRAPNIAGLGLEDAGVTLGANGAVVVDERYQSSVPSIHAIGDVTDRVLLTPVALAEGMVVADRLFNQGRRRMSYENVATAIFSHPNVGTVGLSEEEARTKGLDIVIYRSTFTPLKHTLTGRSEKSLMKLVVDRKNDRVLGVHMVGPEAGEVMQGFAVALNCGATKSQLDATIGIHPTLAEEFVTMREPVEN